MGGYFRHAGRLRGIQGGGGELKTSTSGGGEEGRERVLKRKKGIFVGLFLESQKGD